MGCGSGMTCWRRLRDWQETGIWQAFHHTLLDRLGRAGLIDWSRCSLDAASLPAKAGGAATGPNPTDRGKPGSKRHLVVDRQGIPLAVLLTAANVHDSTVLEEALDAVPPVRQPRGRPRRRPKKLHTDKAYDYPLLPPRPPQAWHRPPDRPARDREQRAIRPAPLGGRTHPVLDRPLPPVGGPLRAPRRRSPRFPRPCLCGDLFPLPPEVLLGGLSEPSAPVPAPHRWPASVTDPGTRRLGSRRCESQHDASPASRSYG